MKTKLLLICLLTVIGCAQKTRKEQASLRNAFEKKDFSTASYLLDQSSLKKDKKNRLLYLMERGNILYYQGNYKDASDIYMEANQLVDKLYTKSIREKLVSSILNDTGQTFYGSVFERSLLYYYQAMSFYKLHLSGEYQREVKQDDGKILTETIKLTKAQRKKLKNNVRNSLMAWDSFFSDIKRMKGVKTFLKDDLVSKTIAAKLHYYLNTRRDKEIALQLYKDAKEILVRVGPAYKTFNKDFKKYNLDLRKVYDGDLSKKKLKSKNLTNTYQNTIDYIDYRILKITKEIRKSKFKRTVKFLKPRKEILSLVKKEKTTNVSVLLEVGHINQLQGKDYSLNLRSALKNVESPTSKALIEGIGIPILTAFAMGPLGLGYVSHHGNVSIYSSHRVGTTIMKEVGIEFEMPYVEESNDHDHFEIHVYQEDKLIEKKSLALLSSLSDTAFINSQEMIENSFKSRSIRVGVKYAVAIAAAYGTYKKVQESAGELFAKPAAITQFLVSSKAIKESEKADARHWSLLPSSLMSLDMRLKPGNYRLELVELKALKKDQSGVITRKLNLGDIVVESKKKSLFSYRAF